MKSISNYIQADFTVSKEYWQLEKLYLDLGTVKGKALTPLEKTFLQGLLCGHSPSEIAEKVYQNKNSNSVRVYLSKGIYKYIQEFLSKKYDRSIAIKNWSRITKLLEDAGYKKNLNFSTKKQSINKDYPSPNWQEKITNNNFIGREQELSLLKKWIILERCKIIGLIGMKGLGKTALVGTLVKDIADKFESIIWETISNDISIDDFLTNLIMSIENTSLVDLPQHQDKKISYLINLLRSLNCLLILDCFESIFCEGNLAGLYQKNHQGYGKLIQCLAQENHNSYCILISKDKPQELALLEAENPSIRSLYLEGLTTKDGVKILTYDDLIGSQEHKEQLVNFCANNPLTIKVAALTVKNTFNCKIIDFLATKTIIFGDIRRLLDQDFKRLSFIEEQIITTIIINTVIKELRGLGREIKLNLSSQQQLEALESLQRRGIVESNSLKLRQASLIRAYIIDKLINSVPKEINNQDFALIIQQILSQLF